MTQLSLLAVVERAEKPRKRVRQVSRQVYAELRDTPGLLPAKRAAVLKNIEAVFERRQQWPTCSEVVAWMHERGELPRPSSNLVSGRLTELRASGVIEFLPVRVCLVTGGHAHPIRIVQR